MPTTWYNYVAATAGTIKEPNTIDNATNADPATESLCPKGWTLPNGTQINSNRDLVNFSPVLGGVWNDGNMYYETTRGTWWGSVAYSAMYRYTLRYNGSGLSTDQYTVRDGGSYIRCVQSS